MGIILTPVGPNGAKVWQDEQRPWRVYGGIGEGIRQWALTAGLPADDTTNSPTSFIATQVGTSPTTVGVADGYPLLITTGATDYNGSNLQLRGATAIFGSTKNVYLRAKVKLSQASTSDFLFGLCELKTDLLKTSTAHGITATLVEGVFFHKVSGATAINIKSYKAGTENVSSGVGTMTTDAIDYAIWWDGTYFHAYVNNVEMAKFAGTIPTAACTPSFNIRTGAASAVTASIAELGYVDVE